MKFLAMVSKVVEKAAPRFYPSGAITERSAYRGNRLTLKRILNLLVDRAKALLHA
jgi:hypothetical protein